jgi:hypothetical protein
MNLEIVFIYKNESVVHHDLEKMNLILSLSMEKVTLVLPLTIVDVYTDG